MFNKALIIISYVLAIVFCFLSLQLYIDHKEYDDINEPMPKVDVTDEQREMKEAFDVKKLIYNEDGISIYRHESENESCVDVITEKRFTTLCETK